MPNLRPKQLKISRGLINNDRASTKGNFEEIDKARIELPVNNQSGPNYTLTETDNRGEILLQDGNFILPQASTENLDIGFSCQLTQRGTNETKILTQGSDILLCDPPYNVLRRQYSTVTVSKIEQGVWAAAGNFQTFDLTDTPNLIAWYDASDEDTVTPNGSNASAIADKSGNGYDLSQPSSSLQPFYTDTWNGRRVLTFDGSSRYFERVSTPALQITGDLTICAAINNFVPNTSNRNIGGYGGVSETEANNVLYNLTYNTTTHLRIFWEYGSGINVNVESSLDLTSGPTVMMSVRDATALDVTFIVNLLSDIVGYSNNASGGSTGVYTLSSAFTAPWIGYLGEYAIFNRNLTSAETVNIRNNFGTKWGAPSLS